MKMHKSSKPCEWSKHEAQRLTALARQKTCAGDIACKLDCHLTSVDLHLQDRRHEGISMLRDKSKYSSSSYCVGSSFLVNSQAQHTPTRQVCGMEAILPAPLHWPGLVSVRPFESATQARMRCVSTGRRRAGPRLFGDGKI